MLLHLLEQLSWVRVDCPPGCVCESELCSQERMKKYSRESRVDMPLQLHFLCLCNPCSGDPSSHPFLLSCRSVVANLSERMMSQQTLSFFLILCRSKKDSSLAQPHSLFRSSKSDGKSRGNERRFTLFVSRDAPSSCKEELLSSYCTPLSSRPIQLNQFDLW